MTPGTGPAPPRSHLLAQQRMFGKYTLIARLAVGGMAEIFLARLEGAAGFRKQVVIKRILPHLALDTRFVDMFLDEARIAARMSHPNVCPVYELGEVDGQLFLAMEYLDGLPLSRMMRTLARAGKAIDPVHGAALIGQACEGLHYAHSLTEPDGTSTGVIHRDVSPQNLFVTTTGVLKVLDFGVAKIRGSSARTRTGTLKGKYAYMSPEQLRGEALDHRSDVFALGVCAFELLTSRRLFARDTDFLVFKAIVDEPIPRVRQVRPEVPAELDEVVARALSRDRQQRPQSARALGETLAAATAGLGGLPGAITLGEELRRLFARELDENRRFLEHASALADSDMEGEETIVDVGSQTQTTAILPTPPPSWREDTSGWSAPDAAVPMAPTVVSPEVAPGVGPPPAPPAGTESMDAPAPSATRATTTTAVTAAAIAERRTIRSEDRDTDEQTAIPEHVVASPMTDQVAPLPSEWDLRGGLLRGKRALWLAGAAGVAVLILAIVLLTRDDGKDSTGRVSAPGASPVDDDPGNPPAVEVAGAAAPTPPPPAPATTSPAPPPPRATLSPVRPERTDPMVARSKSSDDSSAPRRVEPRQPPRKPDRQPEGEGTLTIDSRPWATIYIDGKKLGATPIFKHTLRAGRHKVKAVSESGQTRTFTIEVQPDRDLSRRLTW